MFSNSSTKVVEGHDATFSNLKLLLLSDTNMLFGDPYYGTPLRKVLFAQNDLIIKDVVIDALYSSITTFMPQLIVRREDIQVFQKDNKIYVTINATNLLDYTTNLYEIELTDTKKYT